MDFLLSSSFLDLTFLNLSLKTWLIIDIILLSVYIISYIISRVVNRLVYSYLTFIKFNGLTDKHARLFVLPLNIIFIGWVFILALSIVNFDIEKLTFIVQVAKVVSYFGVVLLGWRLVDLFQLYLKSKTAKTETKFDDLLVPLVTRVLKVTVLLIGILSIAEILKLPLASLVAGLGIGGLAIAMAAKDTIANVFGSVTVLSDRPFNIGDWVKINNTEGSVQSLGFRSTRIRTFYDSVVTVPNSNLLTSTVDNMGQRNYRRYSTKLDIVYSTSPEKITEFSEAIRQLILDQEYTRKDSFHVYFNDFSDSSLQIMLYVFFKASEWTIELQARHDLLIGIMKLADELGVEFAFPTRTLQVESSDLSLKSL